MSNANATHNTPATSDRTDGRHLSAETKASLKSTEFWVYLAVVLAIVVTSAVVGDNNDGGDGNGGSDAFDAAQAMMYITWATIGYMISRGLAKSGKRESHNQK